jgi:hypothetical protein
MQQFGTGACPAHDLAGGGNPCAYGFLFVQDCSPHKPLQRGRQRKRPLAEGAAMTAEHSAAQLCGKASGLDAQLKLYSQQKTVQDQLDQLKKTARPMDLWDGGAAAANGGDNPIIKRAKMAAAEVAIKEAIKQATASGASASEKKQIVEYAVASAIVAAAKVAEAETEALVRGTGFASGQGGSSSSSSSSSSSLGVLPPSDLGTNDQDSPVWEILL